ncbi:recombinase family protein [Paenibacillus kyungheensis]|uniref:Recombinase family protein n=1 Tax=Paenibacillus kyungheensis TaxID=1452732 RepID=A0AAX3M4W3_9BACL|nr:recombinase family protein [Paenibacillus kyungheensis]WCT57324.1 recombinase family protein [Paenibacillus kyungheensis]
MASIKRVVAFYRVSTILQLDGDDILLQKKACEDFIHKQNWSLIKEYKEKAISGFTVAMEKRDEIQRLKLDVQNNHFDAVICFMFDRFGRKLDEVSELIQWLQAHNIEVWSVKEGKFPLIEEKSIVASNLIENAHQESINISMRVTEKHEQMSKEGIYRGGTAPFGYKLVKADHTNKKGHTVMKLTIDPINSLTIKKIFRLVKELGYGSNKIAKHLNEKNITTSTGGRWNTGSINFILRNPIYKGYPSYGKRTSKEGIFKTQPKSEWTLPKLQVKELIIIEEAEFDYVQSLRSARSPAKIKNPNYKRNNVSNSPLLLVGMIKCGYCGSPLTTTYCSKTYRLVDGTIKKSKKANYRCSGKALSKIECSGQTLYSQTKIEDNVIEQVNILVQEFSKISNKISVEVYENDNYIKLKKELKAQHTDLEQVYKELYSLKQEVPKSILGESSFSVKLLSELIEDKENLVKSFDRSIRNLQNNIRNMADEFDRIENFFNTITNWTEIFKNNNYVEKKSMLKNVIEQIIVFKDKIEVKFRNEILELLIR